MVLTMVLSRGIPNNWSEVILVKGAAGGGVVRINMPFFILKKFNLAPMLVIFKREKTLLLPLLGILGSNLELNDFFFFFIILILIIFLDYLYFFVPIPLLSPEYAPVFLLTRNSGITSKSHAHNQYSPQKQTDIHAIISTGSTRYCLYSTVLPR